MFEVALIVFLSLFLFFMVPPELLNSVLNKLQIKLPKFMTEEQETKKPEKQTKSIFEKKLEEKKQKPVKKEEEEIKKISIKEKLKINLEIKPIENHIEVRMSNTPRKPTNLISELTRSPRPTFKGRHKRKASSISAELEDLKKDVDTVKLPDNPDKLEQKLQIEYFKRSIAEAEKNTKKNYSMNDIKKQVIEEEVIVRPTISSESSSSGGITSNALLNAMMNLRKTPK